MIKITGISGNVKGRIAFTYTGDYEEYEAIYNGIAYYCVKLLTSGTLVPLSANIIDLFEAGAGGGAAAGGAGGGYTETFKNISLTRGEQIEVVIGAPGIGAYGDGSTGIGNATDGGYTQFRDSTMRAEGGKRGESTGPVYTGRPGGNGGSGGGGGPINMSSAAGNGGSDGANGTASGTNAGGTGQGRTTRAFEEPDGELYAGGGGAWLTIASGGKGGEGGGGDGHQSPTRGEDGAPNSGGGGGGGMTNAPVQWVAGNGGSGVAIMRRPI